MGADLPAPLRAREREVYDAAEIQRALQACPESPPGLRARAAVMMLWCTGLRPRELIALRVRDYQHDRVRADGREIAIPGAQRARLHELVGAWMAERSAIAVRSSPLFCTLQGGALDSSYLRKMLPALSRRAELDRRLHAQGLRNTFAAAMHARQVPEEVIRRQLGLADPYLPGAVHCVTPVHQQDAMEAFSLE